MPRLNEGLDNFQAGTFQFSGERIEHLTSSELTLVTIAVDKSGSVTPFADNLSDMIKEIVLACRKSPRADFLMLRLVTFNSRVDEEHGFKMLSNCIPDDYNGLVQPGGSTALYDAAYSTIISTMKYAEELQKNDFSVNGIMFIVTDGVDSLTCGGSKMTPAQVAELIGKYKTTESVSAFQTILIGVNTTDPEVVSALNMFKTEANLDVFINMGDATKQRIAKLAGFVSQSVVSSSVNLASGQANPLPSLTF